MSNKKICIISQFYPNGDDMIFSFVDHLVCQFADIGCECTVITPKNAFGTAHVMEDRVRVTPGGNKIKIFCPKYHSYPHRKIGSFDTYRMTMSSYYKAVKSCSVAISVSRHMLRAARAHLSLTSSHTSFTPM